MTRSTRTGPHVAPVLLALIFALFLHVPGQSMSGSAWARPGSDRTAARLDPPEIGLYHAAFPDFGGWEDEVSADSIAHFEALADKEIAWAYFSDNWFEQIRFPAEEVTVIHQAARTPFIRIMPRHEDESLPDSVYTLQAFIDGEFDDDLIQWARDARATGIPLLVEFGTEVNGDWFPWCGYWNGAGETTGYGDPGEFDGPERFRDAYRHIIDLFRLENVDNVTWFFHVDCYSWPEEEWNTATLYYPGNDYIDWIGVSCYGPQLPEDGWWWFTEAMDEQYAELAAISPDRPIALLEFGVIDYEWLGDKAAWIEDACEALRSFRYPRLRAMSWWHENFDQTNLRIDSSPEALAAYRQCVADTLMVTELLFSSPPTGVDEEPWGGLRLVSRVFPNPSHGPVQFRFSFDIPARADLPVQADLIVYDVAGRMVRTLIMGDISSVGQHTVTWDGRDESGRPVGSGLYFCSLRAGGYKDTVRLAVIR